MARCVIVMAAIVIALATLNAEDAEEATETIMEVLEKRCENRKLHFKEELIVRTHARSYTSYRPNFYCSFSVIPAEPNTGLVVSFRVMDTAHCRDVFRVEPKDQEPRTFCGRMFFDDNVKETIIDPSGPIRFIWNATSAEGRTGTAYGFEFTVTPYRRACHGASCHDCGKGNFIHKQFFCNGRNNCGDLSDEKDCPAADFWRWFKVARLPILAIIIVGVCVAARYCRAREIQVPEVPWTPTTREDPRITEEVEEHVRTMTSYLERRGQGPSSSRRNISPSGTSAETAL